MKNKIPNKFKLNKILNYLSYKIHNNGIKNLALIKVSSIFIKFLKEYKKLKQDGDKFDLSINDMQPYFFDRTDLTPIEPVYFFQDIWFAKKIFELKPKIHYDIGSSVKTLSIISQFVPVNMVDIRPIDVKVENFNFIKGDITNLPFENNSIDSLSSLCVIEHIGLGRYGDEIDSRGSEKAIDEIKRILKPKGNLFISLPVDEKNKIYFNAHRAFTREYIMALLNGLYLVEEKYIYGFGIFPSYCKEKGFGTGLYHFSKNS